MKEKEMGTLVEQTTKEWIYEDPVTKEPHSVVMGMDRDSVVVGGWYAIGDEVYECVEITDPYQMKDGMLGYLVKEDCVCIQPYSDKELKERYSVTHMIPTEEYYQRKGLETNMEEICNIAEQYVDEYKKGNNRMTHLMAKTSSSGEVFIPEIRPDDDPFEKVIKSMLAQMKVVLNDYKKNVSKPHIIDNLRSALSGATKNMSITKFLLWCQILELEWEIRLSDAGIDVDNPISEDILVSSVQEEYPWVNVKPAEKKGIFVVPLSKDDDPLKRVVKLALNKKRINTKQYEHKCSSPHLINNMKSALKSKQKMTVLYFMLWCELLDLAFEVKVENPKTGIFFQCIGLDLYSNVDDENMGEGEE